MAFLFGRLAARIRYCSSYPLHIALRRVFFCHQNVSSGVADAVKPPVPQDSLPAFFWSHFELDSRLFAKAIGRSVEDSVVVCHQLLERIAKSHKTGEGEIRKDFFDSNLIEAIICYSTRWRWTFGFNGEEKRLGGSF